MHTNNSSAIRLPAFHHDLHELYPFSHSLATAVAPLFLEKIFLLHLLFNVVFVSYSIVIPSKPLSRFLSCQLFFSKTDHRTYTNHMPLDVKYIHTSQTFVFNADFAVSPKPLKNLLWVVLVSLPHSLPS